MSPDKSNDKYEEEEMYFCYTPDPSKLNQGFFCKGRFTFNEINPPETGEHILNYVVDNFRNFLVSLNQFKDIETLNTNNFVFLCNNQRTLNIFGRLFGVTLKNQPYKIKTVNGYICGCIWDVLSLKEDDDSLLDLVYIIFRRHMNFRGDDIDTKHAVAFSEAISIMTNRNPEINIMEKFETKTYLESICRSYKVIESLSLDVIQIDESGENPNQ